MNYNIIPLTICMIVPCSCDLLPERVQEEENISGQGK